MQAGANPERLAKEFSIKFGKQLIKLWVSRYNQDESPESLIDCSGDYIMAKDIENEILSERISVLENQLSKKNMELMKKEQELVDAKKKTMYLEKHMPSRLVSNMGEENAINVVKTKKHKNKVFTEIYQATVLHQFKQAYLCKLFKVSRSKFSEWIKRNNMVSPHLFNPVDTEELNFMPEYVSKINPKAKELIETYFRIGLKIACGVISLKHWIENMYKNETPIIRKTISKILLTLESDLVKKNS